MEAVMVSIICTNFNKGKWLQKAIDSFLMQQTQEPFEIIIVDDASTDGSQTIIEQYAKAYPNVIRAFYHETNIGITQTWIDICQKANGKYIARCDGDDYWIDPCKLQKQVDLLEHTPEAKWCNTDFHLIDGSGNIICKNAFASNFIQNANTFEQLLATKGFTFPSSWLIETTLLNHVNASIDPNAVDDTFNIQLELFMQTTLVTLPEATVVYRMHTGSDSRPLTPELAKQRFEGLLETQRYYLTKYHHADLQKIATILLEKDAESDMKIFEKDGMIAHQARQIETYQQEIKQLKQQLATQQATDEQSMC